MIKAKYAAKSIPPYMVFTKPTDSFILTKTQQEHSTPNRSKALSYTGSKKEVLMLLALMKIIRYEFAIIGIK